MPRKLILALTHLLAVWFGFAVALYALPILDGTASSYAVGIQFERAPKEKIAPAAAATAPQKTAVALALQKARYRTAFQRGFNPGQQYWGEGEVGVGPDHISFDGRMTPDLSCSVYLTAHPIHESGDFLNSKHEAVRVGEVKTFNRFLVAVPTEVDIDAFSTVAVWCDSFLQLIASAPYRSA